MAANLGAKLTGPRLVKAMEGVFEGPITVSPHSSASLVSWLDIVQFAKANPAEFSLTSAPGRGRVCQFFLKGAQVEITEDDWRLIMSGALDRFRLAPPHPLEEDENAEVATLEIVEQRLQVLIKKADEVARKARQLNYHLSGRKAAIHARMASPPTSQTGSFHAVASPRTSAPVGYDLRADLLSQFVASTPGGASLPGTPTAVLPSVAAASRQPLSVNLSSRPSPVVPASEISPQHTGGDDPSAQYRLLITMRIEKLARGEAIYPPCDRCRRLRASCIKHLTACAGCTKKHAKCAWRGITDDEVTWLQTQEGQTEEEERQGAPRAPRPVAPDAGSRPATAEGLAGGRDAGGYDSEMEQDGPPRRDSAETYPSREAVLRDSSLLTHMASIASIASAAAEARERSGPRALSRGSSAGRD